MGGQPLVQLGDSCLTLSLGRERPAPEHCSPGGEEREPMLARNSYQRFGLLLGEPSFTAALLERGRCAQRVRQTERACPRPVKVVATPLQGLLGIPQQPQEPGEIGATHNARVVTIEHGWRALALSL